MKTGFGKNIILIVLITLLGCVKSELFGFSNDKIVETDCSKTCMLGRENWGTKGIKEWPRQCYTPGGIMFDPVLMKFNDDDVLWVDSFTSYNEKNNFKQHFVSAMLDVCNGACFDAITLKSLYYFYDFYKKIDDPSEKTSSSRSSLDVEKVDTLIGIVKKYASIENSYSSECKECTIDDCDLTPLLQSTRDFSGKSIVFWGVHSGETNDVFYIQRGLDSNVSNVISGDHNIQQKQPQFFTPGYTPNYYISIFDNDNGDIEYYWKLGVKKSTFLQLSDIEDDKERYTKDCNNNNIADVCELLYDPKSNKCDQSNVPNDCLLNGLHKSQFCGTIRNSNLQSCEHISVELSTSTKVDCNLNGIDDELEILLSPSLDNNNDKVLDECRILGKCVTGEKCINGVNKFECKNSPNSMFFKGEVCSIPSTGEVPTVEKPTTQEPTSQEPTSQEPPTEEPTTEEPPSTQESQEPTETQTPPPSTSESVSPVQHPGIGFHPHKETPRAGHPQRQLIMQGSCYVPKNVLKCIDDISKEYCDYIGGSFSNSDCSDRSDMAETESGKINSVQHIDTTGDESLSLLELILLITIPSYIGIVLFLMAVIYLIL